MRLHLEIINKNTETEQKNILHDIDMLESMIINIDKYFNEQASMNAVKSIIDVGCNFLDQLITTNEEWEKHFSNFLNEIEIIYAYAEVRKLNGLTVFNEKDFAVIETSLNNMRKMIENWLEALKEKN